jgi:hypothetical protein
MKLWIFMDQLDYHHHRYGLEDAARDKRVVSPQQRSLCQRQLDVISRQHAPDRTEQ